MTEKNVLLDDFDTKRVLKNIEKRRGLCPSCEKRIKFAGSLSLYKSKESNGKTLFYAVCRKCEYKKEKQTQEKIDAIRALIEKRLEENHHLYSCEEVDDPNIDNLLNNVVNGNKKLEVNALVETLGIWHREDELFFKENPDRKFFARPVYEGELEVTQKDNDYLKEDATKKNISFAIVHSVSKGQRVYSYVSDLRGHPFQEEAFVAALFMVRVNSMFKGDDIYELYEKIKENKTIVDDFKLNKFTK